MFPNKKLVDLNYTIWDNEGIRTWSFNATAQSFAVFTKMWVYTTLSIPETKDDKNFRKVFLKMVVDVERALTGLQNNFLVSRLVETVLKASDPLKKVSLTEFSSFEIKLISAYQGIYRLTNVTYNDDYIPIQFGIHVHSDIKIVTRVQGARKNVILCTANCVVEFKPNKIVNPTTQLSSRFFDVLQMAKDWSG
jgi:hypothetical protein